MLAVFPRAQLDESLQGSDPRAKLNAKEGGGNVVGSFKRGMSPFLSANVYQSCKGRKPRCVRLERAPLVNLT